MAIGNGTASRETDALVAELIARTVVRKEDPKKVAADVREFKKDFVNIKYCFNEGEPAYRYHRLVE